MVGNIKKINRPINNASYHPDVMKVGIICPASLPATQFGGLVFLAIDMARGVKEGRHEPTIYTTDLNFTSSGMIFDKNLPRVEEREGIRIKRAHAYARIKLFFVSPGIYNLIKNDKPDIMHVVGIRGFHSMAAALVSKWHNIPLVLSDQGGMGTNPDVASGISRVLYKIQRPMLKMIIRQASKIIAANKYEKDIFLEYCDSSKVTIVKNWVDVDKMIKCPFDFKKRHHITKYLLFLGRFAHVKGPDILLRAIRDLKAADKLADHKIVMMGSDFGFEKSMQLMIDELGLRDDVVVISKPDREEVVAAYHGCEFLVLPSRWENSPLTPMEGFACKKTTISTRACGIPHVIKDGENGLLFEPEDHTDLAKKISQLLENPEMQREMAARGHQMVVEEHAQQVANKGLIKVYEEIVMDGCGR